LRLWGALGGLGPRDGAPRVLGGWVGESVSFGLDFAPALARAGFGRAVGPRGGAYVRGSIRAEHSNPVR
jgi:hypothetical protein